MCRGLPCAQVCGGYALSLFRPDELERLVCGLPHLDFQALQAAARYEAGFHRDHPCIKARALAPHLAALPPHLSDALCEHPTFPLGWLQGRTGAYRAA